MAQFTAGSEQMRSNTAAQQHGQVPKRLDRCPEIHGQCNLDWPWPDPRYGFDKYMKATCAESVQYDMHDKRVFESRSAAQLQQ